MNTSGRIPCAKQLPGLDPAYLPHARQRAAGVLDGHVVDRRVPGDRFTVTLLPGRWRMGAELVLRDRDPAEVDGEPDWVLTDVETADGHPVPGAGAHGFELDLMGDLDLVFHVAAIRSTAS